MKIIVAAKVVPDDQDILVRGDGSLDMSRASQIISTYDLNAIEAAVRLAEDNEDASITVISVGPKKIDDSKLRKNILARGVDELFMVADDAYACLDAYSTAEALTSVISSMGDFDVVICGDGSADNYAQQVDVQLAAALDVPSINAIVKVRKENSTLVVERMLEDTIETLEVGLPCVISVMPDIALPRIPGMKDILAAGKKPADIQNASLSFENTIEVVDCKAPKLADRKLDIRDASEEGALEAFAAALKATI